MPALNFEPGIYSARYAGDDSSDKKNREKIVKKLNELNVESLDAYYGGGNIAQAVAKGFMLSTLETDNIFYIDRNKKNISSNFITYDSQKIIAGKS